jgi:hypothetical protein
LSDGLLDGGGGRLPVRRGDGRERTFELRPLQQERVAQTAQQRDEFVEHAGQAADIAEAEIGELEPVQTRRQGMVVRGRAPGSHLAGRDVLLGRGRTLGRP